MSHITHTEWYPVRQLSACQGHEFALIILNQPIHEGNLFKRLWTQAVTRVAADGGANRIYELNQKSNRERPSTVVYDKDYYANLNTIIGDLDSLSDEAKNFFLWKKCAIIHSPSQYSTDFTKAVSFVRGRFPGMTIICKGGLGGRVDQGLSQLHHLYMFQTSPTYAEGKMFFLSGESLTFLLKAGKHSIHVREPSAIPGNWAPLITDLFAKYVGIIPVKEPSIITTKGLEWDVENWPTEFGGQMSTSNHVLPETQIVEVETTKDVLFTIALK